jgi:dethiobiotin synthetase
MSHRYFISGIGTGIGKTFVSAVLAEALQADYWKPIQCGMDGGTDSEKVASLISNPNTKIHEESYVFKMPASPHIAANAENVKIMMESVVLPETTNNILIEGAGGLMVPVDEGSYVVDLAAQFETEIILVCSSYLGCINHSLLSIDYLLKNDFQVKGLVLNGNFDKGVKTAIMSYAELPIIAELPQISDISKEAVHNLSQYVNLSLFDDTQGLD